MSNLYKNVLLIDNSVPEYQQFVSSANSSTFPIVYSKSSTKEEILSLLTQNFTTISRIGLVFIAETQTDLFLDNQPFGSNLQFLISIIKDYQVVNIDFLACNTLNHPRWVTYYNILQKNTTVIVGASNNQTGNIQYGGDWVMESTSQDIETIYFTQSIEYYKHLLDYSSHNIVLMNNGSMYGTGHNGNGQLGLQDNVNRDILTLIPNYTSKTPIAISCGGSHSIVLMNDRTIYGTGYNQDGRIGISDSQSRNALSLMPNYTGETPNYISCGVDHTVVVMNNGSIYVTGVNNYGQLGLGDYQNRNTLILMPNYTGQTPIAVSCHYYATVVLMNNGTIYGTGDNGGGQLGFGDSQNRTTLTLMQNNTGKTPIDISCGRGYTIVLMNDGTIYTMGANYSGEQGLGDDNRGMITTLTLMPNNTGKTPIAISCGQFHTMVLMNDGTIYGTGNNYYGQLGNNLKVPEPQPYWWNTEWYGEWNGSESNVSTNTLTLTPNNTGKTPNSISCGGDHTIVLMNDGTIYGVGNNTNGQLGNNLKTTEPQPYWWNTNRDGVWVGSELNASVNTLTTMDLTSLPANVYPIVIQDTSISLNASCYNEGTKIICLNTKLEEEYIPIENLRKGDFVKTYKHGFRKIDLIGKNYLINEEDNFEKCMYKMTKTNENGLLEDLLITGWHSILVDDLKEYKNENDKVFGKETPKIDDKHLLLACVSKDFIKMKNNERFTYYHFTLEGDDNECFGIWANGILTETTSTHNFKSKIFFSL